MSKFKKTKPKRVTTISELDVKFEKIIQFSGWIFLFVFIGFMGIWILLEFILDIIHLTVSVGVFTFIIFSGINSAVSFGLATKLRNNYQKKKEFFIDWLLGEFLFCMFIIFSLAVYQW